MTGVAASALSYTVAAPAIAEKAKPNSLPPYAPFEGPRSRTVLLNDLSGDPDGLFEAVPQILSTSTELRAIVGTSTGRPGETAEKAAALANEMLDLMGRSGHVKVYPGVSGKLTAPDVPMHSPGVQAIIDEAMRTDTHLPLYVAVGGGLTEVASALMIEPKIADRFTLVWIGGQPYPTGGPDETNFGFDPLAAQYIFNETSVRIWQIPRNVFGRDIVSDTEIEAFVAPYGAIGKWLYEKILAAAHRWNGAINIGETYAFGDGPLVVLTALEDCWPSTVQPPVFKYEGTGSSSFDEIFAPHLNRDGTYEARSEGRKIRVYTSIDTRLMISDFYAKLKVNFGN